MIDLELSPVSYRILDELSGVESTEEVLVVTDPEKTSVGRSLTNAARGIGASASLLVMPRLAAHGNEPPETVAAAMRAADVAVTATSHAITHTQARLAASDAGTRVVVLRGVTEDMMISGGMNTDYEELARVTAAVRDVLDDAASARVTAPGGTDVVVDLEGSSAFSLDGYFHDYGFSALPPGEAPTCPQKTTETAGRISIDYSMDNIGLLEEPIDLTVEAGTVTAIDGGTEAARLAEIVGESGDNADNLAEFAIGTNAQARLIGNLAEDKKKRGTVHFAIGDDTSLGGTRRSDIHLDGLVREPTVRLDETVVVESGTLDVDLITDLAADISA